MESEIIMAETNIITPLKKEWTDTGMTDIHKGRHHLRTERLRAYKKIEEHEHHHLHTKKTPYDRRAARDAYAKQQQDTWDTEGPRALPDNEPQKTVENIKLPRFDYQKYGDPKNFKEIGRHPNMEHKLIDGIKVHVQTGTYIAYQSKLPPRCKIDILTPHPPTNDDKTMTTKTGTKNE